MRTKRDYYEILGLPHTATAAEIKKRYRELARKYHPDVAQDKLLGHRLLAQINEAYRVLSDPDARRQYDASCDTSGSRPIYRPSGSGQQQTRPPGARPGPPRQDLSKLVRDAELAFISGRLGAAAGLCMQAIRMNRSNARAHAILGDIYRIQGRKEQAIAEYGYAVQYNPADKDSQAKLEKLLPKARRPASESPRQGATPRAQGRSSSRTRLRVQAQVALPPGVNTANMVGWGLAFFTLFMINIYPGSPIPGIGILLPMISTWSWNVVVLIALDAALVGFLLAVNKLVDHPDEELLFQYIPGTMIPLGFPLMVFSFVFFYMAAGLTVAIGILQGSLPKSLMFMFGATIAVTLLAALLYVRGSAQVALYGGNIAFPAAVIGWYIGSLFAPIEK